MYPLSLERILSYQNFTSFNPAKDLSLFTNIKYAVPYQNW